MTKKDIDFGLKEIKIDEYKLKKNNSGKLSIEYKNLDQLELVSSLLKNKSKN